MQSLYLFIMISFQLVAVLDSTTILTYTIIPNFTATYLQFNNNSGTFLISKNGAFSATAYHPPVVDQFPFILFSVVHTPTNIVVWSANRGHPVSQSASLSLTTTGLVISDDRGYLVWSTPRLTSPVVALRLLDTGNLVLVDRKNGSLWQSFDYPTDTILAGQRLLVGTSLVSSGAMYNSSLGDYRLTLSVDDLSLDWFGQTYWKLSMELMAFKQSNMLVSYMEMNSSGLFLCSERGNSTEIVMAFFFEKALKYHIARIASDGRLEIIGLNDDNSVQKMVMPVESFRFPNICGKLGLIDPADSTHFCSCPKDFRIDTKSSGCLPNDDSLSLSRPCNVSGNGVRETDNRVIKYLNLSHDNFQYFSTVYIGPKERGVDLSKCQDLCSQNCSCLGLAYQNHSSYNCYLIENNFGSIISSRDLGFSVYVKVLGVSSALKKKPNYLEVSLVSVLVLGFVVTMLVFLLLWLRKKRNSGLAVLSLGRLNSSQSLSASETTRSFLVGLPSRFNYNELIEATENFATKIGSGGFGDVYKGALPDKTVVAVKRITNYGARGKKEFLTELAIIGSIRHANLVRLIGFCVNESEQFLVLEFMNQGSLEKILFGDGPVLEWQNRIKVALGTARALAYLHSGCEHKIIHCDIKPENILLKDGLQVKVSDFGLSKLLDRETSKVVTALRGTRGYLAPEWLTSTGITEKSDVYSFGMVLLEIVSGKRNLSVISENGKESGPFLSSPSLARYRYFPSLALEMHKQGRYLELVDPRLEGRVNHEEVEMIIRVALCCVHGLTVLRPRMDDVVAIFEGRLASREPRLEALTFLEPFGGRLS